MTSIDTNPPNATTDPESGLRRYTWMGRPLISNTSLRKTIGLPHDLHQWITAQAIDAGIILGNEMGEDGSWAFPFDMSEADLDVFKALKKDAASADRKVSDRAKRKLTEYRRPIRALADVERDASADLGKRVHRAAELRVPVADAEEELRPFLRQFYHAERTLEMSLLYQEVQSWNLTLGYAGTIDAIGHVTHPDTGERILAVLDWKGLALDTPVATTTGWTTMRDIEVGDMVFDRFGRPTRVLGKSRVRHRPCYRIEFDDGSSMVADDEHRWPMLDTQSGDKPVMTTEELHHALASLGHQRRLAIQNALPLDLPDADLPVDPYLLGVWLGDGTRERSSVNLSEAKRPIMDAFEAAGFSYSEGGGTGEGVTFYPRGFRSVLRSAGLLEGDKRLPAEYLRGSRRQRLALLRGLMDTDGTWNRKRNQACIDMVDEPLVRQVHELVVSLGWRASFHSHPAKGFGKEVVSHRVSFTPFGDNPFLLVPGKRDQAQARLDGTARSRRRIIKAVVPVESEPTQCISVGGDHTFLAGREMVPTHNTGKSLYIDNLMQLAGYALAEFIGRDDVVDQQATAVLHAAQAICVVHLRPEGWGFYDLRLSEGVMDAFAHMCRLANFLDANERIDPFIISKYKGTAP